MPPMNDLNCIQIKRLLYGHVSTKTAFIHRPAEPLTPVRYLLKSKQFKSAENNIPMSRRGHSSTLNGNRIQYIPCIRSPPQQQCSSPRKWRRSQWIFYSFAVDRRSRCRANCEPDYGLFVRLYGTIAKLLLSNKWLECYGIEWFPWHLWWHFWLRLT